MEKNNNIKKEVGRETLGNCGIVEFIISCINQRFNYVTAKAGPVR